jgi:DUF1680 family protein
MSPDEERYAAEVEKSIYNVAIANQQGSHGLRYHTILVGKKEEGTRKNTCCEGQGTRLIGSLPEHIYSIAPDGLYLNLYEPSTITWEHGGEKMGLRMETKFPYEKEVKLTVSAGHAKAMKLRVRVPSWAVAEMKVVVNNEGAVTGKPGSYLVLDRTWSAGDTVSFTLPAGFVWTEYKGEDQIPGHKRYSLTYGPLLYATAGSKDAVLRVPSGGKPEDLFHQFVPKTGAPMQYTVAGNPDVIYMPYLQIEKEEFTCFPVIDAS